MNYLIGVVSALLFTLGRSARVSVRPIAASFLKKMTTRLWLAVLMARRAIQISLADQISIKRETASAFQKHPIREAKNRGR